MIDIQQRASVLTLASIRTDGGTQPRAELNYAHIADLVEVIEDGGTFKDPIVVFYDGSNYWLADGFHRYHAAVQAGRETIEADIKQGTQEDAIVYSCGANATHGLRRSNGDKRRAVERLLLLPTWRNETDRAIAQQCGVSHFLVQTIKSELGIKCQVRAEQPIEPVKAEEEPRLKRTSNEEKRKTVEDFIAETPQWQEMSSRAIARICGVSESLVRAIRSELQPVVESDVLPDAEVQPELAIEPAPALESEPENEQPQTQDETPSGLIWFAQTHHSEQPQELTYEADEYPQALTYDPWADEPSQDEPSEEYVEPEPQPDQQEEVPLVEVEEISEPVAKSVALTALQSSESNEWYTPKIYLEAVRELMGTIDLDPASCEAANRTVRASDFYTQADNGLSKCWYGHVWLNPPYGMEGGRSNQEIWSSELIKRHTAREVTEAVLLVNANTEAKWFQPLYNYLICFTDHRIRFYTTSDDANQPTQGNAFVYFGRQRKRFIQIFSRFGKVLKEANEDDE